MIWARIECHLSLGPFPSTTMLCLLPPTSESFIIASNEKKENKKGRKGVRETREVERREDERDYRVVTERKQRQATEARDFARVMLSSTATTSHMWLRTLGRYQVEPGYAVSTKHTADAPEEEKKTCKVSLS